MYLYKKLVFFGLVLLILPNFMWVAYKGCLKLSMC